jgi:hypothetical protein
MKSSISTDGGAHVRDFKASDVEQVASLWQRSFRRTRSLPSAALTSYFTDILLNGPWYDPQLGPLVLEQHGEIVGFVGRMARKMIFKQSPIRVVISTQLMVDPDRKLGFAALSLVRAMQQGPQDLAYSDGANDHSMRIWTRCGGCSSKLLSFEWTRRLRRTQAACCALKEGHPRLAPFATGVRPLAGMVDAVSVRALPWLYHKPCLRLTRLRATAGQIAPLIQHATSSVSLRPDYSEATLDWLLGKAGESRRFGQLRTMLVLDDRDLPIGWFIYYVRPGDVARVLQMGAMPMFGAQVVAELFRDAWEQGAASVVGQLDPLLLAELSNAYCQFRCPDYGVLLHSKHPEILHAIQGGDVFLSRLEGEWWMRFGIDRHGTW